MITTWNEIVHRGERALEHEPRGLLRAEPMIAVQDDSGAARFVERRFEKPCSRAVRERQTLPRPGDHEGQAEREQRVFLEQARPEVAGLPHLHAKNQH